MTDIMKKTKDSGALVIAYDRLLMNTDCVDYYVTFDSINIGELQGGYIVDKLGLESGEKARSMLNFLQVVWMITTPYCIGKAR